MLSLGLTCYLAELVLYLPGLQMEEHGGTKTAEEDGGKDDAAEAFCCLAPEGPEASEDPLCDEARAAVLHRIAYPPPTSSSRRETSLLKAISYILRFSSQVEEKVKIKSKTSAITVHMVTLEYIRR